MTLDKKGRSTDSKCLYESQEELMCLIAEFDLEDLWRHQNPSSRYIHNSMAGVILTLILIGTYTSTNLRVGVKIDHEINTFSDHF